jgi:hypothetical protein
MFRDLNKQPIGSAPLHQVPAVMPAVKQALSARAGNAPTGAIQQAPAPLATAAPLNLGPSTIQPQLNSQVQAYAALRGMQAKDPGPASPGVMPANTGTGTGPSPLLPATASPVAPANQQRLAQDQARLDNLTRSGSGIDQIQNKTGRIAARIGDTALRIVAPSVEPLIGGTEGRHQLLLGRQQGVVANDEDQIQKAASAADTQSQINERDAQGRRYDAQANYYDPQPMSPGQAQALGHPEWEGLKLDARDAERLIGGAAHNDTTLQTHFGGQQKTLSQADAEAISMPSLAGKSMSNDEYQKTLQQVQRNAQSDTNNTRTNNTRVTTTGMNDANRITTTGMRDSTSTANSERTHPGAGAAKPIPPAIRDRIQSQKDIAIGKARTSFEQGDTTMDEYLDSWQGAQNDYEERLSAQTGGPIPHTDIRSNVDAKGNWIGNRPQTTQPAPAQPQARPSGNAANFVTNKGSHVAIGDPVNVNGKKGTVTGFNPKTGKVQVSWQAAK